MNDRKLVEKELLTAKNRLPALLALLVLLPAAFAGASLVFEDVLPRDSPVAVVSEDASQQELEDAADVLSLFADAEVETGDYRRGLEREDYYLAIQLPAEYAEEGGTVVVHHHGGVVPFDEPTRLLVAALDGGFRGLGTDIEVTRNTVGEPLELSEYLLPVLLVVLVLVLGLMYVPHDLRRERHALDRLALDTSIARVAYVKIAFYTVALALPLLVFHAVSTYYGYNAEFLTPTVAGYTAVTFVYAAGIGVSVALATEFDAYGRLVNAVLLFAAIVLSNLIYPVGFFSSSRREIARLTPTHYSAVAVRSHSTKDIPPTLFGDRLVYLLAFTATALALVYTASWRYRRR